MKPKQPNVLLITLDTLRADALGCHGYSRPTSPFIDGIAEEGLRFENAMAQASWTLPSLASLMTSQYPQEIGMTNFNSKFSDNALRAAEIYRNNGYQTAGFITCDFLARNRGFAEGFDVYEEHLNNALAEDLNRSVFKWLASRDPEKPYFLWIHYFDIHADYDPPIPFDKSFGQSFEKKELGTASHLQNLLKNSQQMSEEDTDGVRLLYDQEIHYLDSKLQDLWNHFKNEDALHDTVTVIASDHGEEFREHGGMLHTTSLYEELVHVPLILHCPGKIPSGKTVQAPVQNLDILPTLLELCGLTPNCNLKGTSLLPSFEAEPEDSFCFSHLEVSQDGGSYLDWKPSLFRTLYMARKGADKMIYDAKDDSYEFYDLKLDPAETCNRYEVSNPKCIELKEALSQWIESHKKEDAESVDMEREVLERLEALGYIE
jgi:arylsulfatase A-like enzyme